MHLWYMFKKKCFWGIHHSNIKSHHDLSNLDLFRADVRHKRDFDFTFRSLAMISIITSLQDMKRKPLDLSYSDLYRQTCRILLDISISFCLLCQNPYFDLWQSTVLHTIHEVLKAIRTDNTSLSKYNLNTVHLYR